MTINPGKKQQLYIMRESNGQKDHDTALPALFTQLRGHGRLHFK